MAFLHDDVLDAALQEIIDNVDELHLCSQEPVTYTEATATYTLGNKATPSIGAQGDRTGGGREVEVAVFSDGTQTGSGTATHWALVDTLGSRLIATGDLTSSVAMAGSGTFTLTAPLAIGVTDAVSA